MSVDRTKKYLTNLVNELRKKAREAEWVEFKHNNCKPDEIGEQISALANSAALFEQPYGYLIWGICDNTHDVIGTVFSPSTTKKGNEELENWLLRMTEPKMHLRFFEIEIHDHPVVILEIPKASHHPVKFKNNEYIRIGSYVKSLKDYPEKERKLWRIFDANPFEELIAAENISDEDVLTLLDYPSYFQLLNQPLPENRIQILETLRADSMISRSQNGHWDILNLGAILFASKLTDFRSLRHKTVRVVQYRENNRTETIRELESTRGYACGFKELINFIDTIIPTNEVIEKALRRNVPMYPPIAIRELVANAIIHQDFFTLGTSPLIEIFKDRIEITNPGKPLIDTMRFLDSPHRSRNEALASFLRRIGFCEERGSGVDKAVLATEIFQLPPPLFETANDNTRAALFAPRALNKMDKEDKIRACYLHACLKYVMREHMTNKSLRERFAIEAKNSAEASRIIKITQEAGLICIYDTNASKRYVRYVPSWAKEK